MTENTLYSRLQNRFGSTSAIILLASLSSTFLFLIIFRDGLGIGPDGWAFWQGAYTLLETGEYKYLSGAPIIAWPPLYSAYLAVFMAAFGNHGYSLLIAQAVLVAAGAAGWTRLFFYVYRDQIAISMRLQVLLAIMFIVMNLGLNSGGIFSNNMMVSLFPFLYLSAAYTFWDKSERRIIFTLVYLLTSMIIVNVHNSSVIIIASISVVAFFYTKGTLPARILSFFFASLPAASAWLIVRYAFGLSREHKLVGGRFSFAEYAHHMIEGIGYYFAPFSAAYAVGALALILLSISVATCLKSERITAFFLTIFLFTLGQWVVFSLVWIENSLNFRFLRIQILAMALLLFVIHPRRFFAVVFVFSIYTSAITVKRSLDWSFVLERGKPNIAKEADEIVAGNERISRLPAPGQQVLDGSIVLVRPPYYPWEETSQREWIGREFE